MDNQAELIYIVTHFALTVRMPIENHLSRRGLAVRVIDLNCDMGESFGNYSLGLDDQVIGFITSSNVACGWHAGDPMVMDATVRRAVEHGVGIGAHPGYPDLLGFGRRKMDCTGSELTTYLVYQVGALQAFCQLQGTALQHVKPHGALYHTVLEDETAARAVAEAVAGLDSRLLLVTLAGSKGDRMAEVCHEYGLTVVREAFPDRAYTREGTLVPRRQPGAVIHDPETVAERALRMARDNQVVAEDGSIISLQAETLCLHGDTPSAVDLVRTIHERLRSNGIKLEPMGTFRER